MEVSPLPSVEFKLKDNLPNLSELGDKHAVIYGVVGGDKDAEEGFKLGDGTPEKLFDEEFSGIIQASIEENAEVSQVDDHATAMQTTY